jgi:hypothetical protein
MPELAREMQQQYKSEAFEAAEDEAPPMPPMIEAPKASRRNVQADVVDQSARGRQRALPPPPPPQAAAPAPAQAPPPPAFNLTEVASIGALRRAVEKEARQARLIRNAVVLGEKEYCVIVDADCKREIKVGPARVFPGPYDVFMIEGSRQRVYDAYELLAQRALWLRVIAPIGRAELAAKLPRSFTLDQER